MWIQVRTIDGSQTRTIEDVSRKATIEELRERVWALFDVRPECQRLFYRGKQVRRAHRTPREARGKGYRAPPERVGWAGPRAWSAARVESTWLPFGWAAREAQSAGPGPAEGAQRGPYQPQSASAAGRVRGGGTQSAETSASPPFSQWASTARRSAWVPSLPALGGVGAPGGGEGSGLWRPCHSAGGEGRQPRLPAAQTRLTAHIASVARLRSRLPNRRGETYSSLPLRQEP